MNTNHHTLNSILNWNVLMGGVGVSHPLLLQTNLLIKTELYRKKQDLFPNRLGIFGKLMSRIDRVGKSKSVQKHSPLKRMVFVCP